MYGAIEAGGTKFVCAVFDKDFNLIEEKKLNTSTPQRTLYEVKNFFSQYQIIKVGMGSFGPIELNRKKENFGKILDTPKLAWKNYNIYQGLIDHLNVPVVLDTDVNAAALGEYNFGAGKNVNSLLYVTIGTGIGAGFVLQGHTYHGIGHPEMGHINVKRHPSDVFKGSCPYHQDCLEGLASGTSIYQRYNKRAEQLAEVSEVWELETDYLAQAMINYTLILRPDKIILGGGVMKQGSLYNDICKEFFSKMNRYIHIENTTDYIVSPMLKDQQGILGAACLVIDK